MADVGDILNDDIVYSCCRLIKLSLLMINNHRTDRMHPSHITTPELLAIRLNLLANPPASDQRLHVPAIALLPPSQLAL